MRRGFALLIILAVVCLSLILPRKVEPLVVGYVRDERRPVRDAVVRIKGTAVVAKSDRSGRFQLPLPAGVTCIITAAKPGNFVAGAIFDRIPVGLTLRPLPILDNEEYEWVDPGPGPVNKHNCANCHAEIYSEWSASSHSNSAVNRHFLNLYEGCDRQGRRGKGWSLLDDHPDGAGVCTACHAPTVKFSDAAFYNLRQVKGVTAKGVHCDYCHKVADVADDPTGLTHGRFGVKLLRPTEGQLFFGPLDDVDRGEDSFSPIFRQSRYCASCHEGVVFGVHVYSTYTEWLASPARRQGKQCQTCHMSPTGQMTNIAPNQGGIPRDPWTLASHHMQGGQAEMLRRCLQMSVAFERTDEGVRALVALQTNDVGHRVPTGFIDRHLLLIVEGLDREGISLNALSGPRLPAVAGRPLAGLAGRVYSKQITDFEGRAPVPFWRAQTEFVDTRLQPDEKDKLIVRFPRTTASIRVRLLYRRFWQIVAESKEWLDNEIVVYDRSVDCRSTQ